MDRSEAYKLLAEEMFKLASLDSGQLKAMCENAVEIDRHGANGILYRVELRVQQKSSERFMVAGSIHDNSGYRFSLLEECLEFDVSE